jgi:hypothetical protein
VSHVRDVHGGFSDARALRAGIVVELKKVPCVYTGSRAIVLFLSRDVPMGKEEHMF